MSLARGQRPPPDVRCRRCGASLAAGDEFEVVVPYKAASQNELAGLDRDGRLLLGDGDQGNPTWFGRAEIVCRCGHQWVSDRKWANRDGY